MDERYASLDCLTLWGGIGCGHRFHSAIDNDFRKFILNQIDEARRVRQERRKDRNLRNVIKSLSERGLEIVDKLTGYDENDVVGLTGEIVMEDFIVDLSFEPVFPKWRYSGTSKSRGIDLVARKRFGDDWELVLYEAKHLHDEIRNQRAELCHNSIRSRFKTGMEGFELDKTRFDLANILGKMGDSIRLSEAAGSDATLIREYRNLISEGLSKDSYSVNVVAFADAKHCNDTTFQRSVTEIPIPLQVGRNHSANLTLIESAHLEETTEEVYAIFAGAF